MQGDKDDSRNVIPRWRSIAGMERTDIAATPRAGIITKVHKTEDFAAMLPVWRSESPEIASSELFDTFTLTADRRILNEALNIASKNPDRLTPQFKESLRNALTDQPDPIEIRRRLLSREDDTDYLRSTIRVLKRHTREYPRDALAFLEIARLYLILGQSKRSEHFLYVARNLAPDDRIILRATLQFYNVVGDLYSGLKILRRSDRMKYDPWVQSAEIAAATILGKEAHSANRRQIFEKTNAPLERNKTELAMAIATLERENGAKERRIFQLVSRALPETTENGFAQAVWLSGRSSRTFENRFPDAQPSDDAYEANVIFSLNRRNLDDAGGFAELWLEDQPFSADALIRYLNIFSIHLEPTKKTVAWAKRGMQMHPDDWQVLNAVLVSLTVAKDYHGAQAAFTMLQSVAPSGYPQAFVEAGRGILAFAIGDLAVGRKSYERALSIIKRERRADLSVNAIMFWLKGEVENNLITTEVCRELIELIEKSINRLAPDHRNNLSQIWGSLKKNIIAADHLADPDRSGEFLYETAVEELKFDF